MDAGSLRIPLLFGAIVLAGACTAVGATPAAVSSPTPSSGASSTPIASLAPTSSARPPATGRVRMDISLVAGPVCPVERNPPDPSCAPRPVADATIVVRDAKGAQVAQLISSETGHATVELAPGTYVVGAAPVAGIMVPPQPVTIDLRDATSGVVRLTYDTGIR
jgi:hypothetical protein